MRREAKDTYKYHLKQGKKVVLAGATQDPNRREAAHQVKFPGTRIHLVGEPTTMQSAIEWVRRETDKIRG